MISSNSPASILPAPMIEQLPDEIADFCAETEVKEPEEEVYLSTPCPIPSLETNILSLLSMIKNSIEGEISM